MKERIRRAAELRKRKLLERLDRKDFGDGGPVLGGGRRTYEISERIQATPFGGVGPVLDVFRFVGLSDMIDERLRLLRYHRPYHESDHVINLVLNFLCGGECLDDLERLRNDPAYLNGLGTRRIPDPTTAGDFLRRFNHDDNRALLDVINEANSRVWREAGVAETRAILDVDASIVETTGERKECMDISYKGDWGFHPLIITEANTGTHVYLWNRPGNYTSHQDAAHGIEYAVAEVEKHFAGVRLRGDSAFNLTRKYDEWDAAGIEFCFGCPATENLRKIAENLPENRFRSLKPALKGRPAATEKERRVRDRGMRNIEAYREHVAEFRYQPTRCAKEYRVIVVRKTLRVTGGQLGLFPKLETRYFFYITNIESDSPSVSPGIENYRTFGH